MKAVEYKKKLLLIWKNPKTRERIPIAELWKGENHKFKYIRKNEDKTGSVDLAIKSGYIPFGVFSDLSKVYFADKLFDLFATRLNAREDNDNKFELLSKTRGKLPTDNLEFISPNDFNLEKRMVEFNIVGWKYLKNDNIIKDLTEKKDLKLKFNTENSSIIEVWTANENYKLGFVPEKYADYIDKSVMEDDYIVKLTNYNDDNLKIRFIGNIIKPNSNNNLSIEISYSVSSNSNKRVSFSTYQNKTDKYTLEDINLDFELHNETNKECYKNQTKDKSSRFEYFDKGVRLVS